MKDDNSFNIFFNDNPVMLGHIPYVCLGVW